MDRLKYTEKIKKRAGGDDIIDVFHTKRELNTVRWSQKLGDLLGA